MQTECSKGQIKAMFLLPGRGAWSVERTREIASAGMHALVDSSPGRWAKRQRDCIR